MRFFSFLIPLLLIVGGCTKSHVNPLKRNIDADERRLLSATALNTKADSLAVFKVGEVDLQNYVRFRQLEGKSKGKDVQLVSITPIKWDGMDCLYVIQYQDGYEIISADKRSQVPIAINENGTFALKDDIEGFRGHLDLMAEQIWFSLNGDNNFSEADYEDKIKRSLHLWHMVNAEVAFFEKRRDGEVSTKAADPSILGHWELVNVSTEEVTYDSIPHLTETRWFQRGGYNLYCPMDLDTLNQLTRCPAGCVAIAGAQMLYFLYRKDGVPVGSPTTGYCTGYVYDNSYVQSFSNPSLSSWENMICPRSSTDTYAALLIGDIGKRLNMSYHWNGSPASTTSLINNVFNYYGWGCSYFNGYNSNIIVSNLLAGYPVVCGGHRQDRDGTIGHVFLIDSYKRCRTRVTSTYMLVYDNPVPGVVYPERYWTETLYDETPHVSFYRMNWGQQNTTYNDTWCSLEGVWQYDTLPPYSYYQKIVYDFTLL